MYSIHVPYLYIDMVYISLFPCKDLHVHLFRPQVLYVPIMVHVKRKCAF